MFCLFSLFSDKITKRFINNVNLWYIMLEKLVEENKLGEFVLDLHPSANRIFAENGAVEKSLAKVVNFTYNSLYRNRDTSNMSGKEKVARLAAASALIGTMGTIYVAGETTCRASESVVRGTGRLAELGYQKAAEKWTQVEDFGQKVADNYKHLKKKIPQSAKNLFHRFKDYLVVGLSVAAIGLSYGGIKSCGEEPEPAPQVEPAPPRPVPTPEPEDDRIYVPDPVPTPAPEPEPTRERTANPLNQFDNQRVLAYCANQMEKDYVIETLGDHNNRIRSVNINDNETQATIVNAHGNEVHVDIVMDGETIPEDNYDIITLRGHVQDMLPLQRDTQAHEADNTVYLLGGCRSAQFIDNLAEPNRAVIASTATGYGPMNTYLLLRVIDEMDNNNTWEELNRDLRANSQRVRNEFVLPNTPRYSRR